MDLTTIRDLAWHLMGERQTHPQREKGYIFYHGQRVGNLATQLRKLIYPTDETDDEVILIGGWFHDVAKGIEPHWQYGGLLVEEILKGHCPPTALGQIREIVQGHTLRKEKDYPSYVRLVQDADILDHYGTMEVWLNFAYAAGSGGTILQVLDFYEKEYKKRLAKVMGLLNYPHSVSALQEKDEFLRGFMARLQKEGAGELLL